LKNVSIKKLKLVSHIEETTRMLRQVKCLYLIDFKCLPINAGEDLVYFTEWASIIICCKKDLTLLFLELMKASFKDVKNDKIPRKAPSN
jgi:hypothetical protein